MELVKLHEIERIENKKLKDKAIEDRRKLMESNIEENEKNKQILNETRKDSKEKHEERVQKVLKKKFEIENQKYWEETQRIRYKC